MPCSATTPQIVEYNMALLNVVTLTAITLMLASIIIASNTPLGSPHDPSAGNVTTDTIVLLYCATAVLLLLYRFLQRNLVPVLVLRDWRIVRLAVVSCGYGWGLRVGFGLTC